MGNLWMWVAFNLFVLFMLVLDLGIFHRKAHIISFKEAIIWSLVWMSLAFIFNYGLYLMKGEKPALEFLTGYILEKSLSVDNIFVFILIFKSFKVPQLFQHKILFWGVLGALIMRAIFIGVGVTLMQQFHWVIYLFGGFLVFTGIKMFFNDNSKDDGESGSEIKEENHSEEMQIIKNEKNLILRITKKFIPMVSTYQGDKFFIRLDKKLYATPLFLVLLLIETSDLVFALDSIPAILAITPDPFIVYTSNIFAILGLRPLFFAVGGMMDKFAYLHYGLSGILIFIGAKMLLSDKFPIPIGISLGVVGGILFLSILASVISSSPQKNG